MSIELKTTSIDPVRKTFDHIAEKIGPDKAATRYQEAVWGLQPIVNQHYRPTWQPEKQLYDTSRTKIVMADFDDLIDPRQYYYGTWTIQRGKQQDSQEKNFSFVESRGLLEQLDRRWTEKIHKLVIPMRHVAWGANTNNSYIAAYGFGAPITSAASMHMMDHLGIAQYLTRTGLILGNNSVQVLDDAKALWMDDPVWQPMRELVETAMVTKDWFELFVLQNLLIDGTLHPLVFEKFDALVSQNGGAAFSMMNEFAIEWFAESSRWVDAVIKIAIQESDANRAHFNQWVAQWLPRVRSAIVPLSGLAFDDQGDRVLNEVFDGMNARLSKLGITG
jgi:phenol/toluene 2-monooxygenase (NADH) P1/A1